MKLGISGYRVLKCDGMTFLRCAHTDAYEMRMYRQRKETHWIRLLKLLGGLPGLGCLYPSKYDWVKLEIHPDDICYLKPLCP